MLSTRKAALTSNRATAGRTWQRILIGCVVAGVLSGLIERYGWFSPNTRLLLFTGILGGFTTFSAFGVETAYLLRRGEVAIAFAYVGLSVLFGIGALLLAMKAVP